MPQTLVLSVGLNPAILDSREPILQSVGYIVVSAPSIKEAVHHFQDGDFDLIILCHTLPIKDCERLIKREFPRLCRGGSSSLTFAGVHPRNSER
jgi:DNA-binding response OmpR family regulator